MTTTQPIERVRPASVAQSGANVLFHLPKEVARTGIVCTLKPSDTTEKIESLARAGMSIVRINLSHVRDIASIEAARDLIAKVREIETQLQKPIGIMLDTQGPEYRTHMSREVAIEPGQRIVLEPVVQSEGVSTSETVIRFRRPDAHDSLYEDLAAAHEEALKNNTRVAILIADMSVHLEVLQLVDGRIDCEVIRGTALQPNKNMNFTNCDFNAQVSVTLQDAEALRVLASHSDYVAQSFVTDLDSVKDLRNVLDRYVPGRKPGVIAKIENRSSLKHLRKILRGSGNYDGVDAVMVARGDLRAAVGEIDLPRAQRTIMKEARESGVPVILATGVLEGMETGALPTRAEVDNLASGIYRGASMVMFSGETVGEKAEEVVKVAARCAKSAESDEVFDEDYGRFREAAREAFRSQVEAWVNKKETCAANNTRLSTTGIALRSIQHAERMGIETYVICTKTGNTARDAQRFFPRVVVVGLTDSPWAARRMLLFSGVCPVCVETFPEGTAECLEFVSTVLKQLGFARTGECVVASVGFPTPASNGTNTMTVLQVG